MGFGQIWGRNVFFNARDFCGLKCPAFNKVFKITRDNNVTTKASIHRATGRVFTLLFLLLCISSTTVHNHNFSLKQSAGLFFPFSPTVTLRSSRSSLRRRSWSTPGSRSTSTRRSRMTTSSPSRTWRSRVCAGLRTAEERWIDLLQDVQRAFSKLFICKRQHSRTDEEPKKGKVSLGSEEKKPGKSSGERERG